jgi:hypothetical protein
LTAAQWGLQHHLHICRKVSAPPLRPLAETTRGGLVLLATFTIIPVAAVCRARLISLPDPRLGRGVLKFIG